MMDSEEKCTTYSTWDQQMRAKNNELKNTNTQTHTQGTVVVCESIRNKHVLNIQYIDSYTLIYMGDIQIAIMLTEYKSVENDGDTHTPGSWREEIGFLNI